MVLARWMPAPARRQSTLGVCVRAWRSVAQVMSISGSGLLRWVEIDVGALRQNAAAFRAHVPRATQLLVMVKSNGYGHGTDVAARAALDGGAEWLGVYTPDEALWLRDAGYTVPVLVAGWSPPSTHRALIENGVDISVFDVDGAASVTAAARELQRRGRVHVKLDSGLGRLGVRMEDVPALADAIASSDRFLDVAGIFTHYADAE